MKALATALWGGVVGILGLAAVRAAGFEIGYGVLFGAATALTVLALLCGELRSRSPRPAPPPAPNTRAPARKQPAAKTTPAPR
jgi:hypothetical protein